MLLIYILLKIKECGIRSVQQRRWNEKKSVFETAFFFSEKEEVTVDVDIGYVGRNKNIIAVD